MWGTGFVCLTKNFLLYVLLDFESPFIVKLKNPGLFEAPTAWTVVEPQLSSDQKLQVLWATSKGTIYVITETDAVDMLCKTGPYTHLSLAPSGKLFAAYWCVFVLPLVWLRLCFS